MDAPEVRFDATIHSPAEASELADVTVAVLGEESELVARFREVQDGFEEPVGVELTVQEAHLIIGGLKTNLATEFTDAKYPLQEEAFRKIGLIRRLIFDLSDDIPAHDSLAA